MGTNRTRWRERRGTLPAKRRRRRTHRRDVRRGGFYEPMEVHRAVATRGVHSRLRLAFMGLTVAFLCVSGGFVWPQTGFGLAALSAFAFCALNLTIAALLSARREEAVHRLAHSMEDAPRLEDGRGLDGNV